MNGKGSTSAFSAFQVNSQDVWDADDGEYMRIISYKGVEEFASFSTFEPSVVGSDAWATLSATFKQDLNCHESLQSEWPDGSSVVPPVFPGSHEGSDGEEFGDFESSVPHSEPSVVANLVRDVQIDHPPIGILERLLSHLEPALGRAFSSPTGNDWMNEEKAVSGITDLDTGSSRAVTHSLCKVNRPSCPVIRRKHENRYTVRLPKPKKYESRCGDRVRTTNFSVDLVNLAVSQPSCFQRKHEETGPYRGVTVCTPQRPIELYRECPCDTHRFSHTRLWPKMLPLHRTHAQRFHWSKSPIYDAYLQSLNVDPRSATARNVYVIVSLTNRISFASLGYTSYKLKKLQFPHIGVRSFNLHFTRNYGTRAIVRRTSCGSNLHIVGTVREEGLMAYTIKRRILHSLQMTIGIADLHSKIMDPVLSKTLLRNHQELPYKVSSHPLLTSFDYHLQLRKRKREESVEQTCDFVLLSTVSFIGQSKRKGKDIIDQLATETFTDQSRSGQFDKLVRIVMVTSFDFSRRPLGRTLVQSPVYRKYQEETRYQSRKYEGSRKSCGYLIPSSEDVYTDMSKCNIRTTIHL
ncbi:hypothetical protein CLF_110793 [Clonorchis sinensis]|uniref:Uncharacterized protein n=1 Tax=Clonorchis sinensis TaxID=79923 RepID=G7YL62_CLOSI|nr:hypothetical protein CLF_110793 [Clonorchis sinensis]